MIKIICVLVGALFFIPIGAKEVVFECQGAKVKIDMPENKFQWINADPELTKKDCTFWRDDQLQEYSKDIPFGGSVSIFSDEKIFRKTMESKFLSSSDPREGTWDRLKKQKVLYSLKTPQKEVYISSGYFRSKYLAKVADGELEEVIGNTISIKGVVAQRKVFVDLGVSLPYKSLTEAEVVQMMKSVEVMQGFAN